MKLFFYSIIFGIVIASSYTYYIHKQLTQLKSQEGSITSFMQIADVKSPKEYAKLKKIPLFLSCSIIKAEDRVFFRHAGFDLEQIKKVVNKHISNGFRLGGSTITQQLARNIFLDTSISWFRKLHEAYLTVVIEKTLTKNEILELYFNHIQFGKNIWGVAEASTTYFNKPVNQLNLSEALFLTSLIAAPESDWTGKNLNRMQGLYTRVARQLLLSGAIDSSAEGHAIKVFNDFKINIVGLNKQQALRSFSNFPKFNWGSKLSYFHSLEDLSATNECGLNQELASAQLWEFQSRGQDQKYLSEEELMREVLLSQGPTFVNRSADGRFNLYRSPLLKNFELSVSDVKSGNLISKLESESSLSGTTWHPFSSKIAFARRVKMRLFEIVVWDPIEKSETIAEQYESERPPGIRWSPDGNFLSYTVEPSYSKPRLLRIISWPERVSRTIGPISRRGSFDWSPDSASIAFVPFNDPGGVSIADLNKNDRTTHKIVDGECFSIHWGVIKKSILASCRQSRGEFIEAFKVELLKSTVTPVVSASGDVIYPFWHPNKRDILFHLKSNSGLQVILNQTNPQERIVISPESGFNIINGITPDRQSVLISSSSDNEPQRVIQVSLNSSANPGVVHSSVVLPTLNPGLVKSINLVSPDGLQFSTFHWPARKDLADNKVTRAVLFVHGGPDAQVMPSWNIIYQFLAARGIHVLAPNFRGSSGYGYKFEQLTGGHEDRIQDILTTWQYIVDRLKIPSDQIAIMGHSYGALLAIDSLRKKPDGFGVAMFLSPVFSYGANNSLIPFSGRSIVFRGALDIYDEVPVRIKINQWFGKSVEWINFSTEGHTFSSVETLSKVYGKLFETRD